MLCFPCEVQVTQSPARVHRIAASEQRWTLANAGSRQKPRPRLGHLALTHFSPFGQRLQLIALPGRCEEISHTTLAQAGCQAKYPSSCIGTVPCPGGAHRFPSIATAGCNCGCSCCSRVTRCGGCGCCAGWSGMIIGTVCIMGNNGTVTRGGHWWGRFWVGACGLPLRTLTVSVVPGIVPCAVGTE